MTSMPAISREFSLRDWLTPSIIPIPKPDK